MGKLPDLTPARSVQTPSIPLELPRLVMRGALVVALLAVALVLVLGLWRAREDMRDELAGATTLAQMSRLLARGASMEDSALREELQRQQRGGALRHLQLRVRDAAGRVLLEPEPLPPRSPLERTLVALDDLLFPPPVSREVSFTLPRPDGSAWSLQWIASHDSEQHEALAQLTLDMAEWIACVTLMLLVIRWNIRRSFRPLASLLSAIGGLEHEDLAPMRALPSMPLRELEAIAGSLRRLAGALEQAEQRRRVLGTKVLTLQEEERVRIARELHDELGQHLTALRADAAWLQQRLAALPELAGVARGMGEQCARVQQAVRALLTRLRPFGDGDVRAGPRAERVLRLRDLLQGLVDSWSGAPGCSTRYTVAFDLDGIAHDDVLPLDLLLAVYRASQEALTNIARHAVARQASLRVLVARGSVAQDGTPRGLLQWTVQDDGRGTDIESAWQRGSGLAGMKDRLWAAGADLVLSQGAHGQGLRLDATLHFAMAPAPRTQGHAA
jgi:two-component system sensor histidine kinase UhpB